MRSGCGCGRNARARWRAASDCSICVDRTVAQTAHLGGDRRVPRMDESAPGALRLRPAASACRMASVCTARCSDRDRTRLRCRHWPETARRARRAAPRPPSRSSRSWCSPTRRTDRWSAGWARRTPPRFGIPIKRLLLVPTFLGSALILAAMWPATRACLRDLWPLVTLVACAVLSTLWSAAPASA